MTELEQQPRTIPWLRFRKDMLTAREVRHTATIDAVRRFVDGQLR